MASAFLAYGLGGQYLPGILRHDGVTYKMLCEQLYLVTEGLYGIPLAVSSTMIFAFVMFGCFLQRAGLGQVFLDLACVLTRALQGRARQSFDFRFRAVRLHFRERGRQRVQHRDVHHPGS